MIGLRIAQLVVVASFFSAANAAAAEFPKDRAPLPPGAYQSGEGPRYATSRSYQDVLDYYKRLFRKTGGVRWYTIISQPGVRAKHIRSVRSASQWEGINVAEYRGKVHVYVLEREPKKKTR